MEESVFVIFIVFILLCGHKVHVVIIVIHISPERVIRVVSYGSFVLILNVGVI
jgi:hypothetical protein